MDKSLILAVAGSGKTYHIIKKTNLVDNFLIITYTKSGTENLRRELINRYKYVPNNIKIYNYFSFLYSFCYKPYLKDKYNDRGIDWEKPDDFKQKYPGSKNRYMNASKRLYANRLSKLITEKGCLIKVINRIKRYYDSVYIDEIQDFASHDFDFLLEIIKGDYDVTLVGDFDQHTYDTSRDGNKKKNLYNNRDNYIKNFEDIGIRIDTETLVKSRRCSQTVCNFINKKLDIPIVSYNDNISTIKIIKDPQEVKSMMLDNTVVKLFYQKHKKYNCFSNNWGNCKGLSYDSVCVVVNDKIYKQLDNEKITIDAQTTKNKFYVACSRTRGDLFFICQKAIDNLSKSQ